MKKILFIILFSQFYYSSQAQIFGRLVDRVVDGVVDHAVEKASQEIANKLIRNINKKFDDALQESYDSTDQNKYPTYESYLDAMNKSANVPSTYQFDLWMDVETKDGKNTNMMRMYYSNSSGILGMENIKEDEPKNLIVMDIENDLSVMYSEKNDTKTAQAIPSFQKMTKFAVNYASKENQKKNFSIEKSGRTKTIAKYKCDEYIGTSDDGTYKLYLAQNFPIKWKDSYIGYWMQHMSDDLKNDYQFDENAGMMMYMKSKDKDGKKGSWKVKKVVEKKFIINNSDYQF